MECRYALIIHGYPSRDICRKHMHSMGNLYEIGYKCTKSNRFYGKMVNACASENDKKQTNFEYLPDSKRQLILNASSPDG